MTKLTTFLFSFSIFISLQVSYCDYFSGFHLTELGTNENIIFPAEAAKWTASGFTLAGNRYTQCVSTYIMGGQNVIGTSVSQSGKGFIRSFTNLPSHNKIHLSFTLFMLDAMTTSDYFRVDVGTRQFKTWPTTSASWGTSSVCAGSAADNTNLRIFIQAVHTTPTLDLKFLTYSTANSATRSYGFRDVRILFVNTSISVSETICTTPGPDIPALYTCNGCFEGQYYDTSSLLCELCNDACTSCYGPDATDCFQCEIGYGWSGRECVKCDSSCNGCHGPTASDCDACATGKALFIFNDGALYSPAICADTSYCQSPLVITYDNYGNSICSSPCASSEFIYWDRGCNATCAEPLHSNFVTHFLRICQWTCPLTSDLLYWDGYCGIPSSCSAPPLQIISYKLRGFCAYPCKQTEYLYWDGSCESFCPFPFKITQTRGRSFCEYICSAAQVLYWDGTCQASCSNPPLIPYIYKTKNLCQFTCAVSTDYLYPDGTCDPICQSPLEVIESFNKAYCTTTCSAGRYLYWDGTCQATCQNPSVLSSYFHNILVCNYPCSSTQYAYPDSSCAATCDPPLSESIINQRSYCISNCNSGDSLYWDGTCVSGCPSPLTPVLKYTSTTPLCTYTCTDLSDYLYWNKTCSASCNSPFIKRISQHRNFCDFPCSSPTGFMNWDGSCVSGCTFPYVHVTYGLKDYCRSPCDTGKYMLADGSCETSCRYPLVPSSFEGALYCNSPCPKNQFFYVSDESCQDLCQSPLVILQQNTVSVCDVPCSTTQFRVSNGSCVNSCPSPMIIKTVTNGKECVGPCPGKTVQYYNSDTGVCSDYCFSNIYLHDGLYLECTFVSSSTNLVDFLMTATSRLEAATLLTLVDLLGYIKYTDVSFSPRLSGLAVSRGRNFISIKFGFNMPRALKAKFTQGSLPIAFERFGTPSNFLVNFWKDLTSWLIVLLAGVIFALFEEYGRQNDGPLMQTFFKYLKTVVVWNLMIMLYVTSIWDIIMFISIQFRAVEFDGAGDIVSFILAILLLISIPVFLFFANRHFSRIHVHLAQSSVPPEKALKYQVLTQGYSVGAKRFYLVYIIRSILLAVISGALVSTAVTQAIFNTLISVAMVFYIIKNKPIKRRINYIQLVSLEVIVLITNFCMFIVTVIDAKNDTLTTGGIFFSDLVILGNFCAHALFLLILFAKFIIIARDLSKLYKVNKDLAKIGCINFILAYLQQGAFGFEEILDLDLNPPQRTSEDEKRNLMISQRQQHHHQSHNHHYPQNQYDMDAETPRLER